MLQTNMNDNKKEIRERKHSSFDSIVCWYPSYYAESGDDLLSIQTFFFHPDYDCRYRSCNGSCLYLGSRTIPPIGIFTLPWRVCGCKSNDFICYKQKKKEKNVFLFFCCLVVLLFGCLVVWRTHLRFDYQLNNQTTKQPDNNSRIDILYCQPNQLT